MAKIAKLTWPDSWCHPMSKHLKDDSFGLHLTFCNTHQTHDTNISVKKFFFIHQLRTSLHNFQKFTSLENFSVRPFKPPVKGTLRRKQIHESDSKSETEVNILSGVAHTRVSGLYCLVLNRVSLVQSV